MKVIKEIPTFELKSFVDKKSELDDFFNSITYELADNYMFEVIRNRKADFLSWLNKNYLIQLLKIFDSMEVITEFEWKCRQEILTYLTKFDMYLLQCIPNKEDLEFSDLRLKKRMIEFNKDFDNELSIL